MINASISPYLSKPPQVQIAASRLQFRACKGLWLFNDGILPTNLITGEKAQYIGGGGFPVASYGRLGPMFPMTTAQWIKLASMDQFPTAQITVCLIHRKTDSTIRNSAHVASSEVYNSASKISIHLPYSDGTSYWDFGGNAGAHRSSFAYSDRDTNYHRWALTAGPHGSAIWCDGVLRASNASANSRTASSAGQSFYLNIGASETSGDNLEYAYLAVFDEEWSPEKIRAWSASPWGELLESTPRRIPAVSGLQVTGDFTVFFESLQTLEQSRQIQYASERRHDQPFFLNYASVGSLQPEFTAQFEGMKSVAGSDRVIQYEGLQALVESLTSVPYEARAEIMQSFLAWYEPRQGGTDQGIGASAALDVLPEIGSAIFERWSAVRAVDRETRQFYDGRETGRLNFDASRKAWNLSANVGLAKMVEIRNFIVAHLGAGRAFYFYDLEANGFQYNETGMLEDGRYLMKFVGDTFEITQEVGSRGKARFTVSVTIIEVE